MKEQRSKVYEAYSKCWLCIKDGSAAEKDVLSFSEYGVCLCDKHIELMMKDYLGVQRLFKDGQLIEGGK